MNTRKRLKKLFHDELTSRQVTAFFGTEQRDFYWLIVFEFCENTNQSIIQSPTKVRKEIFLNDFFQWVCYMKTLMHSLALSHKFSIQIKALSKGSQLSAKHVLQFKITCAQILSLNLKPGLCDKFSVGKILFRLSQRNHSKKWLKKNYFQVAN